MQTWSLGTWFSGGLGSAMLTVGLDLKGLFQPKYDSNIHFDISHMLNANRNLKHFGIHQYTTFSS